MKKLNLLSKAEMKKIMGGTTIPVYEIDGPCGTSECTTNADCKTTLNPKCKEYNCISDGSKVTYCVSADA